MKISFTKRYLLFIFSFAICLSSAAQKSTLLNQQFLEFMKAYPDNFKPLINGRYNEEKGWFDSKVGIEETKELHIISNNDATNNYIEAKIDLPYSFSDDQSKILFSQWAKKIAGLNFNGAKLIEIKDPEYDDDDFYVAAKAWQLNNTSGKIAQKYQAFTIRLELRDYEMGGWELAIAIADFETSVH